MRFSIIVPVYNSVDYLPKCLDSLCGQICMQTNFDYEIICVNDGSTDNSQEILCRYMEQYPFVHLYNQPNQGPSAARNHGIGKAVGEYILFCDSDDWYERPTVLDELNAYILLQNRVVDSVHFCGNTNFEYTSPYNDYKYDIYESGKQLLFDYCMRDSRLFFGSANTFCYRRCLLSEYNILFDEHLKCREDALFVYDFLHKAKYSIVYPEPCYYYNVRPYSLITSESLNKRRAIDAIKWAEIIIERGYADNKNVRKIASEAYNIGIKSLLAEREIPNIKYKWLFFFSATSIRKIIRNTLILWVPAFYIRIFVKK